MGGRLRAALSFRFPFFGQAKKRKDKKRLCYEEGAETGPLKVSGSEPAELAIPVLPPVSKFYVGITAEPGMVKPGSSTTKGLV